MTQQLDFLALLELHKQQTMHDVIDAFQRAGLSVPRFPRARISDPRPSHDAASLIERTGTAANHSARILTALQRLPGSTCREIAKATGLEYPAVSKRLKELVSSNKLRCAEPNSETVPCAVLGKQVCRWHPL